MRSLILLIISTLLTMTTLSAATVSGEISGTKSPTTNVAIPKTPTIKYYTGTKGGCYMLVKNAKTGKMIKRYVNKSFCKK